ncbi:hypothetical protein [Oceaniradius stylonematis]|uniref:hypothetical protein n=1 Tax=Oceaniradius stylonematis TaxID=2184161 RepID=UPI00273DE7D1|nr:hypothetical protein [Oceaniradius stylonematis]
MPRMLFDDEGRQDKARKMLVHLLHLQGHFPKYQAGSWSLEPAGHKEIAIFVTGKCLLKTTKGMVNGIVDRGPYPPRRQMSKHDRQSLLDVMAAPFRELFGQTLVCQPQGRRPEVIPPFMFTATPLRSDHVERARDFGAEAIEGERPAGPGAMADARAKMRVFCHSTVGEPGRAGRVQNLERTGLLIRDLHAGVMSYCENVPVLADDDGEDRDQRDGNANGRRFDLAKRWADAAQSAQVSPVASPSMELGGRVQHGPKTASDHTMDAWSWRSGFLAWLQKRGLEAAFDRLDRAFLHEEWVMVDDREQLDAVKFALDLLAVYHRAMSDEMFEKRWSVSLSA